MNVFETVVVTYVLNSLWQVTLLFVAAWIASRFVLAVGSRAEHRVWVGAMLLGTLLPALSILPWRTLQIPRLFLAQATLVPDAQITTQMGEGVSLAALRLPAALM